jgi:hypothetical protein
MSSFFSCPMQRREPDKEYRFKKDHDHSSFVDALLGPSYNEILNAPITISPFCDDRGCRKAHARPSENVESRFAMNQSLNCQANHPRKMSLVPVLNYEAVRCIKVREG